MAFYRSALFSKGEAGLSLSLRETLIARFMEVCRVKKRLLLDKEGNEIKLPPAVLWVFEAIFKQFHNSKTGQCNPSYTKIAECTGLSASTVGKACRILEKVGIITIKHRYQTKKFDAGMKKVRVSNQFYLAKGALKALKLLLDNKIDSIFNYTQRVMKVITTGASCLKQKLAGIMPTAAETAEIQAEMVAEKHAQQRDMTELEKSFAKLRQSMGFGMREIFKGGQ